jgi:hypothetical protein
MTATWADIFRNGALRRLSAPQRVDRRSGGSLATAGATVTRPPFRDYAGI